MIKTIISIVSPCYNEEENVEELYHRVSNVMSGFSQYDFEYVFVDNASTDGTTEILRRIAFDDNRVKVIINNRNFGHIRSPYWGLMNTSGKATIYLASDFQDPPELIPDFIKAWELGYKVVLATKPVSKSNVIMAFLRRSYYRLLDTISEVDLTKDTTGFGLYDQEVLNEIKKINDPYPYFRGLVCELGFSIKTIEFSQPRRLRGISKNNFYTLFDIAMLGIVSHSKVPLRLATIFGFFLAIVSFISAIVFLFYKIMFWNEVPIGVAPFEIMVMMLFGILFVFLGLLGEYVGSIHTFVQQRPIVVERERINF